MPSNDTCGRRPAPGIRAVRAGTHLSALLLGLGLCGPLKAEPGKTQETPGCRVALLPDRVVKCGEPKRNCPCLSVANACPYDVRVFALVDGSNMSAVVAAKGVDATSFCSSNPGVGDVQDIGWLPTEGNPLPGEPQPSP